MLELLHMTPGIFSEEAIVKNLCLIKKYPARHMSGRGLRVISLDYISLLQEKFSF